MNIKTFEIKRNLLQALSDLKYFKLTILGVVYTFAIWGISGFHEISEIEGIVFIAFTTINLTYESLQLAIRGRYYTGDIKINFKTFEIKRNLLQALSNLKYFKLTISSYVFAFAIWGINYFYEISGIEGVYKGLLIYLMINFTYESLQFITRKRY